MYKKSSKRKKNITTVWTVNNVNTAFQQASRAESAPGWGRGLCVLANACWDVQPMEEVKYGRVF